MKIGAWTGAGRPFQIRSTGLSLRGFSLKPLLAPSCRRGFDPFERVQRRIESDYRALPGIGGEPGGRRDLRKKLHSIQRLAHLRLGLQRVAAVGQKHGLVFKNHRAAGRAGKARKPGQPVGIGWHIFVLKLVGLRNDEAVKARRFEHCSQCAQAAGCLTIALLHDGAFSRGVIPVRAAAAGLVAMTFVFVHNDPVSAAQRFTLPRAEIAIRSAQRGSAHAPERERGPTLEIAALNQTEASCAVASRDLSRLF